MEQELNPRRNARCAWILNLPRIRLHTFSHALLPQRGAAPVSRIPPGRGGCLCDCLPIGSLSCASLFSVYLARFVGRSLLHKAREKCDDHDDSYKNGHADILTLKIGGRSSVDANIGGNGSHNFIIAVAMLMKTCQV